MKLIKTTELSKILRIKPATVRLWALEGKIPSLHHGKTYRFILVDVLNALKNERKED